MEDFTDLQRLLRLKRYETPPSELMQDFLSELHRRQRAELLKRPLWRLALDRIEGALPTFNPSHYAYAGACACAVLTIGVVSNRTYTIQPVLSPAGSGLVAGSLPARSPVQTSLAANQNPVRVVPVPDRPDLRVNLYSSRPSIALSDTDFDRPRPGTAATYSRASQPRYVLDSQPVSQTVSYEQPYSF